MAFTDGTVFSSFAMLDRGRPQFLSRVIEYLYRGGDPRRGRRWFGALAIVAAGELVIALVRARGARARCALIAPPVAFAGMLAADAWCAREARSLDEVPPPRVVLTTIAFVRHGFDYHKRPALVPDYPKPDTAFDTYFAWTQRLGHLPVDVPLCEAWTSDASVMINPVRDPDRNETRQLRESVEQGGACSSWTRS